MNLVQGIQNIIAKNGTAQSALAVTAVIGSSVLLYNYFVPSSSKLAPAIDEEEAKKIMNGILKKLKILIPKLLMAVQNIKMQIQQQGQEVDDMTIMKQFILPHFESNLKEIQDSVLEEHDVDEDELEEAVTTYIAAGDEELASLAKSIKVMYQQFGGDVDADEPAPMNEKVERMGINDVVALMKELGNQMMQYTDDFCGKFIDEHGIPQSQQDMEEFQLGLMAASQR